MSRKDENITCQQAEQWLVDFLYGELDPAAQRLFQLHLESCPQHRQEVASLRQVLELVRGQPEEAPEALSTRIRSLARSRLEEERKRRPGWQIVLGPWTAALAASLAVMVLAVALWPAARQREKAAPEPAASPIAVTSTVELADSVPARPDQNLAGGVAGEKTISGDDNLREEAKAEILPAGAAGEKTRVAAQEGRGPPAEKPTIKTKFARPSSPASPEPAQDGKQAPADTTGRYAPAKRQQAVAAASPKPLKEQESPPGKIALGGEAAPSAPEQKPAARPSGYAADALRAGQAAAGIPEKIVASAPHIATGEEERHQAPVTVEAESEPPRARAKKGAIAHGGDAEDAQSAYARARNFMEAGDCRRQVEEAERALKLDPRHRLAPQTLLDQASCLVKLQRFEEARAIYRRLEREFPAYQDEADAGLRRLEGK
jgi:tetratricopeptide (TPR) repeat protein